MDSKSQGIFRVLRIAVSVAAISLLTWVLVSNGMDSVRMAGILARIQFFPAAAAFSISTIVVWLIITLIFGRIYCSTVCPLGTLQDVAARIPRTGRNANRRVYSYRSANTSLRNIALFVIVVSLLLGVTLLTSLLDPFSIYSRFCVYTVKPLWVRFTDLFATTPGRLAAASATGITVGTLTIALIAWLAARSGRIFCNTICPVGTTLGFVSRYAVVHIDINTDKCIQCRKCEHVCKAHCINMESHVVDTSRCVVCFDCLPVCPNDAIHYTTDRHRLSMPLMQKTCGPLAGGTTGFSDHHVNTSAPDRTTARPVLLDRRAFLATGAVIALSPAVSAARKKRARIEGGLFDGQTPVYPSVPVTPPGVYIRKDFLDSCTGCGLCVSHCMTKVLKASVDEYGLLRMFHPVKDYDRAYCAYGCTRCTHVCPTGALKPLTKEEKYHLSVGLAKIYYEKCVGCGKCAEACPTGALTMEAFPNRGFRKFPEVDPSKCIGCGACQYVCPAKPSKAIIVNGLT